ncbi:flippase-like domain-containing protein [Thermocrinis sp.]|uniref:flippase-like domain-containing protein n=1 Tax=Thermocrinis sp. TaxID=2024383 RepID=UPI002FDCFE86
MLRSFLYGVFLTLIILAFSFIYVIKKTLSKDLFEVFLSLDKRFVFFSLFSMFLYHTFDNLRLFILSRAMNLRYPFLYGYVVSFINTFGATITPAHVGGEMMSLYTLSRKGARFHKVMSIVTMKTLTGTVFFVLFFPFVAYYIYDNPTVSVKLLIILAVFGLSSLLFYIVGRTFFNKAEKKSGLMLRIRYAFNRFLVATKLFLRKKKVYLILSTIMSVLLYISFVLSGVYLIKAFEQSISFYEAFYAQVVLLYAIFFSPTPGGSGVGELGGVEVFSSFLSLSAVGGFVILWRFITQYISAIVGGVLFFFLFIKDSKGYLLK